jgi:hypothetical protein
LAAAGLLSAAGLEENRPLKKPQIEASKPLFSFMIIPLLHFLTPSAQHNEVGATGKLLFSFLCGKPEAQFR